MTNYIGYVGTYTKGNSEGIYTFTLDTAAAKLTNIKVAAQVDNPTYLTLSNDNRSLYSVVKEGESGGIAAFSIDQQTGELTKLNEQVSLGAPPCHVSVSRNNGNVFSANYHKGTVESYSVKEQLLEPAASVIEHHGSGPDERQEKAHTHYAAFTPDEKYVVAIDLGIDKIFTYGLENEKLVEKNSLAVKPGSGPRHLTFHPSHKFAYVMTEFSSEVIVLDYHAEDGRFTEVQTISTLPADFKENNQGSAIHISSDGRFIYAGNRGHNSIALFAVNEENGTLTFIEHTSTFGDWPRDFVLDPSESFFIASNQNSSNLVLYSRDKTTGKLQMIQSDITVPDPVCVKFMND